MRRELRTLDVGAYADGHFLTLTGRMPVRLAGTRVSAELFSTLGVAPAMGRWLRAGEDESPNDRFAILSHASWQTRFGGDPLILGKSIELDGQPHEVVAVMPAAFEFPSRRTEVWVPLGLDPRTTARYWAGDFMPVIGRLRQEQAWQMLTPRSGSFSRASVRGSLEDACGLEQGCLGDPAPRSRGRRREDAFPDHARGGRRRASDRVRERRQSQPVACGGTTSRDQHPERALGAAPRRVAQQLITESIVLAFLGAGAGVLVAAEGLSVLKLVLPPDTPRLMETYVSWRALLFAGVLAIVTGAPSVSHPLSRRPAHGWKARSIRALADPAASSPRRCALPSPSPRSPARCCF